MKDCRIDGGSTEPTVIVLQEVYELVLVVPPFGNTFGIQKPYVLGVSIIECNLVLIQITQKMKSNYDLYCE